MGCINRYQSIGRKDFENKTFPLSARGTPPVRDTDSPLQTVLQCTSIACIHFINNRGITGEPFLLHCFQQHNGQSCSTENECVEEN